jgi:hypothetical protein
MSKEGIQRELEQLQKDVAALSAARQREDSAPASEEKDAPIEIQPVEPGQVVEGQVGERHGLLPDELPRVPAVAVLAGFLIGMLLGRCLR